MLKSIAASLLLALVCLTLALVVQSKSLPSPRIADKAECGNIQLAERYDCFPEINSNQQTCEARGCCWVAADKSNPSTRDVPWCFYPKNYGGYEYVNRTDTSTGQQAYLRRTFQSPYPNDVQLLRLDIEYQTDNRVRVKVRMR